MEKEINFKKELERGRIIVVTGECEKVAFWLSNWGEVVYCYSAYMGGTYERSDMTVEHLLKHLENMKKENRPIEVKSFV